MVGTPHEDMCVLLGSYGVPITTKTLRKHYKHELAIGKARAHIAIGGKLFKEAMEGDRALLIYYTKAQMGWRENHNVALTDPDGRPLGSALREPAKPVTEEEAARYYLEFSQGKSLLVS